MKLTENLKKTVEKAQTKEEAKEAIRKAGMLLTDDELDQVSGGEGYYRKIKTINYYDRPIGD